MTTQTQTHDHATMYAILAGGGLLVLSVIALWFYAS
jgi:hypothetical protein